MHDETAPPPSEQSDALAPEIAAPLPLPQAAGSGGKGAGSWAGLGLLCAVAGVAALMAGGIGASHDQSKIKPPTPLLMVPADQVPGVLLTVDPDLLRKPHARSKLALSEPDKDRLAQALTEGRLRLGKITVWDTFTEGDDHIRIEGVGFVQDVLIMYKPQTFLVPFVPGGTIRISAIKDDDGGGVSLGVSTILGPVVLPHFSVGQTVEIPVL